MEVKLDDCCRHVTSASRALRSEGHGITLRHKIGGTSTYKSEGYSVGHVSGMIQDDKGKQESDDKDLGG